MADHSIEVFATLMHVVARLTRIVFHLTTLRWWSLWSSRATRAIHRFARAMRCRPSAFSTPFAVGI